MTVDNAPADRSPAVINVALILVNNGDPFEGAQNAKASDRSANHGKSLSGVCTPECGCREWGRSRRRCWWVGSWYIVRSRDCERPPLLCTSPRLRRTRSRVCSADMLLDPRRPGLGWLSGHLVQAAHPSLRLNCSRVTPDKLVGFGFSPIASEFRQPRSGRGGVMS